MDLLILFEQLDHFFLIRTFINGAEVYFIKKREENCLDPIDESLKQKATKFN